VSAKWFRCWALVYALGSESCLVGSTPFGPLAESGAGIRIDHSRGLYQTAFDLAVTYALGTTIYYTTNGSAPTVQTGSRWTRPLHVSKTTTLRLLAVGEGSVPLGPIETHTFIFPKEVAGQTGAGFPSSWGVTNGRPVQAAYRLADEILNDPQYKNELEPALQALPSVSIVMDRGDLFDSNHGIYANPQKTGISWERSASIEWIDPDPEKRFQIDCGIRIQGGWNRRPEESPKHAFRLVFNRRYGAGRLIYPLFGAGVSEFETLVLRGGCNNTWLHWSGEERKRGDYIRDQWMRDTLAAMGHASARGRFVHLYLDGLYWGIYNLVERPSAPFLAAHFGGAPKDYDCRNGDHLLEGTDNAWQNLMRVANKGVTGRRRYEVVENLVDLPQFIDYMLANLYGANQDWDRSSNWYAGRRRRPAGKFEFFVWDGERTLEGLDANILDTNDDQSPTRLFQRLRENEEFRQAFADRVQKQLFGNGALTPKAAGARYQFWADQLDSAIVAESARWGNYRRDVHPYKTGPYELYTRDEFWRPEVKRLLTDYFPKRSGELLKQLRAASLYPAKP
jgi:hypothetical protein